MAKYTNYNNCNNNNNDKKIIVKNHRPHVRGGQPVRRTRAHEYQCSKLKRAIMHEFLIAALNEDVDMILWQT